MRRYLWMSLLCLIFGSSAQGAVKTKVVEYKEGETVLEGFLAYDDAVKGPRPGVLVVHAWKGLDDYTRKRTTQLAELGYVAFAADIYGKGVRPTTFQEAGAASGKFKNDRALLRARVNAGLETLKRQDNVDKARIAAIGYCFGGTTVLELARSGAQVNGVVSFHGGLDSPTPADGANIKSRVLVLHGADDPFVPEKDIQAFVSEMRTHKVDWEMVSYGGAVHAFTDPAYTPGMVPGAEYNAKADQRSWEDMKLFFKQIFG